MAVTETTLPGNGTAGPFTYTFPALEAAHVKVSVDNVVQTVGVDYSLDFVQKEITFLVAPYPTAAETIRIYRETDDTALEATFYSGAAIRSQDLNNNFIQALYVAQETRNTTIQASTGNLADGSITSNLIADGAVSTSKLGTNSVTEAKLSFIPLKSTDIGTTVQGYDADTAKLDVAQTFTAQQTFSELKETVYTLGTTGSIALDPANGSIQHSVLTGTPTFTDSLEAGQSIVLMLENGSSYAVTWPTITWVRGSGNSAPTLTAKDTFVLWKVSTTLYGAYVGSYV